MSIGIMACRKLMGRCSGTGCFKAYNNSKDAFKIYEGKKEELGSFFYCIGCKDTMTDFEEWEHKIKQLKNSNIDTVHIALCVKVECDRYSMHEELFKKEGFEVVHGSHK